MGEDPAIPDSRVESFIDALWKDAFADALRPLADYLVRFPGRDEEITREYALLEGRSAAPAQPREKLGPYQIVREIGRGGQGTVYLADDLSLGRPVALKVLEGFLGGNTEAIERFRREAEITSKLDTPGICAVYAIGEDRGSLWIAMRYVDGEPLAKTIAARAAAAAPDRSPSGPRTRGEIASVLALFEQTARILHVAHENGVIHRDIKPGNVMVTKDGEPVVLDFGLAQDLGTEHPTLTATGSSVGTPAYMSPEQIATEHLRLDRRTDVYSLGVSLYESLTHERPFDAPTREGLYRAILTKDPTSSAP